MAEMHLSEKPQVSGKITFKFAVKNLIPINFMGDTVLPSHKSDKSLFYVLIFVNVLCTNRQCESGSKELQTRPRFYEARLSPWAQWCRIPKHKNSNF